MYGTSTSKDSTTSPTTSMMCGCSIHLWEFKKEASGRGTRDTKNTAIGPNSMAKLFENGPDGDLDGQNENEDLF